MSTWDYWEAVSIRRSKTPGSPGVCAYLMPWLLAYSLRGILSFPLENEFASGLDCVIGKLVN